MIVFMKRNWIPIVVGLLALIYYTLLCAKSATWIFTSTDNGDWLAAATKWMVPQPYGSPLYILLCRLLYVLPGDLALKLTVGLSVVPSAITVATVYVTVKHFTQRTWVGVTSALIVLGSAVFLSQSTILEEYALATMFLTLAIYGYVRDWKYRTVIFLGLGIAVHMMVLVIAFFWILADHRWRMWLGKPLLVLLAVGVVPYGLIPILMAMNTPRFLIGEFSMRNLVGYWSTTARAVAGTMSVFEAPRRFGEFGRIFIMSFGLGLVPLLHNIYKPYRRLVGLLLATIVFIFWYAFTCIDPSTYTFFTFLTPAMAVLIGVALSQVSRPQVVLVAVGACVLIIVNSVCLNAGVLAKQDPKAVVYFQDLRELPDSSLVVTITGGYSVGLFYVINEGKDITPVIYPYVDNLQEKLGYGMIGYDDYLQERTGYAWSGTLDGIQEGLNRGLEIYFIPTYDASIQRCFNYERDVNGKTMYGRPSRIYSLTGINPREPTEEVIKTND